jgi:hypothetical protein
MSSSEEKVLGTVHIWGRHTKKSKTGLLVRVVLAAIAVTGSIVLAWSLLTLHGAHAAGITTITTKSSTWGEA